LVSKTRRTPMRASAQVRLPSPNLSMDRV